MPSHEPSHPQANRHACIQGQSVAYRLRRAQRKTIGLTIDAQGLTVSAPRWTALGEIDQLVQQKADWILRKLQESQQKEAQRQAQGMVWQDGGVLPYLGQNLRLQLDATLGSHPQRQNPEDTGVLRLGLSPQATPPQIKSAVQTWLMRQARRLFEQRLQHFAPVLGVSWQSLRLSSAKTRWGSATSHGRICLNWRLMHLPLALIDYVVVHELSHLRVMDHSPRFWSTVAGAMPDYAQRRKLLRQALLPIW